jgi:hypothetical protein
VGKYIFCSEDIFITESENTKHHTTPSVMSNQASMQHLHPLSEEEGQEEKVWVQEMMMGVDDGNDHDHDEDGDDGDDDDDEEEEATADADDADGDHDDHDTYGDADDDDGDKDE